MRENITEYRQRGIEHLNKTQTSFVIESIGSDPDGREMYGIHLIGENKDEWYNDNSSDDDVLAWESEQDANKYAQNYMLPNFGLMSVLLEHRRKIRTFQMMLNSETSPP